MPDRRLCGCRECVEQSAFDYLVRECHAVERSLPKLACDCCARHVYLGSFEIKVRAESPCGDTPEAAAYGEYLLVFHNSVLRTP
jgi:hypothetical protein